MNVFQEIKLAIKLQPILRKEQKLLKMKLSTSTVSQILLGICDYLNIVLPITTGQGKIYVGALLGILHVLVNTIAHLSNPDGSPAVDTDYVQTRNIANLKDTIKEAKIADAKVSVKDNE